MQRKQMRFLKLFRFNPHKNQEERTNKKENDHELH
jgi:hypothetical protein